MFENRQVMLDEGNSKIDELFISYESSLKLKNSLGTFLYSNDSDWINSKAWLSEQIKHTLSSEITKKIKNFKSDKYTDALIIRGLPIDIDLPSTPYNGYISSDKLPLANAIHIGIYALADIEPISYTSENDGLLFRHVVPACDNRHEKSSQGSTHTFGMHVDNPDLPLITEPVVDKSGCPEFLSLMAIRSDLKVKSSLVFVDDIIQRLNLETINELSKKQFVISRPDSFKSK